MRRDHKNHIGSPCRPVFAFPFELKMKQCYLVYGMPSLVIFEYTWELHCRLTYSYIVFHLVYKIYGQQSSVNVL